MSLQWFNLHFVNGCSWYLFMCLFALHYPLWWSVFYFLVGLFAFLLLSLRDLPTFSDTSPLSNMWVANTFSQTRACLFILFTSSSRANIFNFNEVHSLDCISFMDCAFDVTSKNCSPNLRSPPNKITFIGLKTLQEFVMSHNSVTKRNSNECWKVDIAERVSARKLGGICEGICGPHKALQGDSGASLLCFFLCPWMNWEAAPFRRVTVCDLHPFWGKEDAADKAEGKEGVDPQSLAQSSSLNKAEWLHPVRSVPWGHQPHRKRLQHKGLWPRHWREHLLSSQGASRSAAMGSGRQPLQHAPYCRLRRREQGEHHLLKEDSGWKESFVDLPGHARAQGKAEKATRKLRSETERKGRQWAYRGCRPTPWLGHDLQWHRVGNSGSQH